MDRYGFAKTFSANGLVQELTAGLRRVGNNRVYRVWRGNDTAILKIYGSASGQSREMHALEALASWASLPSVLDSGIEEDQDWVLFRDAGQWNLETLPENPGLARTAGRILRELHSINTDTLSNLSHGMDQAWIAVDFQSTLRRLDRYRGRVGLGQDAIDAARSVNPPFASDPVASHTDAVTRNFVVDDVGRVTLISWEWAALAPPEWDLSRAAWTLGMHAGPAASEALFEGYGKTLSGVVLDRWIAYHAAQILVHQTERGSIVRPSDVPASLIDEFNRAVLGASS